MSTQATQYNVSQFCGSILDQGKYGSCVENSLSNYLELTMAEAGVHSDPISRMFSYNMTREFQGTFDKDTGSTPYVTLALASVYGLAPESSFGYTDANMHDRVNPVANPELFAQAALHKIGDVKVINASTAQGYEQQVAAQLDQGKPVMLTFNVRPYFFAESGPLNQQVNHGTGDSAGGHCVLIVGMDNNLNGGSYIVENSWGTSWGDKGLGTISYSQYQDFTGAYTINGYEGVSLSYNFVRTEVATTYAMLLNRPAEVSGLDFWAGLLSNNNAPESWLANNLINSAEGKLIYGDMTDQQFIGSLYQTTLGRTVDDASLNFWASHMSSGMDRGTVFADILEAVQATDTHDIMGHDYAANKADLAEYITIALQYKGNDNAAMAAELAKVDTDASHTEIIKVGISHDMTWASIHA